MLYKQVCTMWKTLRKVLMAAKLMMGGSQIHVGPGNGDTQIKS